MQRLPRRCPRTRPWSQRLRHPSIRRSSPRRNRRSPLREEPSMRRLPLVLSIAAISVVASARTARAQSAEAEALFNDGDAKMKAGKLDEACQAFEASNRIEPRAGTLIRLGECREQNKQLASAWSAYKDALTRVKDTNKKVIAQGRVSDLEP